MSQPESNFIKRVHKRLGKHIFYEKMEGSKACPDYRYEGKKGDLWVEYKVAPNGPSKLQHMWLLRAWGNGIPAWVVTLMPDDKVLVEQDNYGGDLYSIDEVVRMIAVRISVS